MIKKCLNCGKDFIVSKHNPTTHKFCCYLCEVRYYYNDNRKILLDKMRVYRKTEGFKESQRRHNKKRIRFEDKRVNVGTNPHKGICELCGSKGETVLHHIEYGTNPLEYTVECCRACHAKIHYNSSNLPRKPFKKGHPYYKGRWKDD